MPQLILKTVELPNVSKRVHFDITRHDGTANGMGISEQGPTKFNRYQLNGQRARYTLSPYEEMRMNFLTDKGVAHAWMDIRVRVFVPESNDPLYNDTFRVGNIGVSEKTLLFDYNKIFYTESGIVKTVIDLAPILAKIAGVVAKLPIPRPF